MADSTIHASLESSMMLHKTKPWLIGCEDRLTACNMTFQMPGPIMTPISRIANVALQMILFLDSLKFVSWPVESRAVPKDRQSDHQDCAASDFVSPLSDIRH